MVAWNPAYIELKKLPDVSVVYDSKEMPGELVDILMVSTDKLKEHPELGKALTGAWFEALSILNGNDAKGAEARKFMAELSGTSLESFTSQVKTTAFYYDPGLAAAYARVSPEMVKAMDLDCAHQGPASRRPAVLPHGRFLRDVLRGRAARLRS